MEKRTTKKLSFFLLLFLFFFYTTSLFENWSTNNTFQKDAEITSQKCKTYEKIHTPKNPWELPPDELFNTLRVDEEYIWKHFFDHYTHYPSIFSWIPFQSFKLYLKETWYNNQVRSILNVWAWKESYRKQLCEYRTEFHESVDIESYKNTEKLWEDYASWLMDQIPQYEEVKKDFDDIPEKLNGATNEKRLIEFYEKKMKMLKENYEAERPERILYDIEILKNLDKLAENGGAILVPENDKLELERFEEWEFPYTAYKYYFLVAAIALLQTLFVSVGYWKLIKRNSIKENQK
jgi:hypothetical protein